MSNDEIKDAEGDHHSLEDTTKTSESVFALALEEFGTEEHAQKKGVSKAALVGHETVTGDKEQQEATPHDIEEQEASPYDTEEQEGTAYDTEGQETSPYGIEGQEASPYDTEEQEGTGYDTEGQEVIPDEAVEQEATLYDKEEQEVTPYDIEEPEEALDEEHFEIPEGQITESGLAAQVSASEEQVSPRRDISSPQVTKKLSIAPGSKDDGGGGDSALTVPSKTTLPFCFMDKRLRYRVYDDTGADVTPDDIVDLDYVTMEHTFSHAAFESKPRPDFALKSLHADIGMKVYATTIDLDDIRIDYTIDTAEGYTPEEEYGLDEAPSAFYLPKMITPSKYPPEILVCLSETETICLFDLPSFCYDKSTTLGAEIEQENENYQYITVGKGRNRKMGHQETQTRLSISKNRHSVAKRPQKKNQIVFAAVWDMIDTYAQKEAEVSSEEEDDMVMYQSVPQNMLRKKRLKNKEKKKIETWEQISQLPSFLDATVLCFRVLASKDYADAQKKYRGLVSVDPLALDLVYIYTMKPLWTLECDESLNRPISSVSFNPKNPNILAVGHGKFAYADKMPGLVCIWNTKNPCAPERLYRFVHPVTAVAFANKNPNWLAVAFANGDVCIMDVTSHNVKIIARSKRDTNPGFEPIWSAIWVQKDGDHEYVMTTGQDGRINRFTNTKTHDFICTPMMRIAAVEGKMKGLEAPKPCLKVDVPIVRYPAALCMMWHPTVSHIYSVGTDEGCIHRCSTHYLNQHMDVYKAHTGPVYAMIYSPFMKNLLVTCGADNAIRLWIEDMDEVIMTLNCPAAVYDIAFCPINSTILISASGNVLSVWDLRRKTHIPCTEYTFPQNVVLTYVKFSESGDNLFVGDTTGRVYTFHLEDTPIPPYDQRKMLDDAIKRALCTRPLLLLQLEKLEKFNIKKIHQQGTEAKRN